MPKIHHHRDGYTLMEIMAVMAILGIMMFIAGPRIGQGFRGSQLKTGAKHFAAALRAARSIAVAHRAKVTVRVEMDGQKYGFDARYFDSPGGHSRGADELEGTDEAVSGVQAFVPELLQEEFELPEDVYFIEFQISEGARINTDNAFVEFYPKGYSTGGIFIIGLEDGPAYAVTVDRVTGKVFLGAYS